MGLLYDWNKGDKPPSEFKLPFTGVFFGEADDMYSSTLTEIVVWIFDVCYIAGIEFRFANTSHNRQLGNTGPFDEEFPGRRNFSDSHDSNVSLIIDGGAGERLKSLEVQERGATVVGMKVPKPNETSLVKNRLLTLPDKHYFQSTCTNSGISLWNTKRLGDSPA